MKSILKKADVEALLPQKSPMAMVDKLFSFRENFIMAGLTVTQDNIFVSTGKLSEVGIIEHMAQSIALYTSYKVQHREQAPPIGYIGAIKEVHILALPLIGDEMVTKVEILQEFMGITLVSIRTTVNGAEIATGQMKTALANSNLTS